MSNIHQYFNNLYKGRTSTAATTSTPAAEAPHDGAEAAPTSSPVEAPQGGATTSQGGAATSEASNPTAEGGTVTKLKIYNLIIADESGSMSHLRNATLSGINETIGAIRAAQQEFAATQEHYLSLVTFDTGRHPGQYVRTLIDRLPIVAVEPFADYNPCGGTPLYDAIGQSLTRLEQHVRAQGEATAVVTVMTDGLENASRQWDAQRLRQLIERLKEEGWTFSYMGSDHDVKEVTDLLAIENSITFSHDEASTYSLWANERSSRMAHYRKLQFLYDDKEYASMDLARKKGRWAMLAKEYYNPARITPNTVTQLQPGEVFVFGSNAQGMHDGGAARYALEHFGAQYGVGEGMQGQCYALPTMEGAARLAEAVRRFIDFATQHPELRFLVTPVGCGTAGYSPRFVAPLFQDCIAMEHVALPADFWLALGLTH